MQLPELYNARLIKRYKRFLADMETSDGQITAHCPNTGAMTGCAPEGAQVWYSLSDNPKRKYAATWELVETEGGICSVNTGRANALVAEAIEQGVIADLGNVATLRREVAIPQGDGRFDLALENSAGMTFIEVKSVTLLHEGGTGAFPDAVSTRAVKHVNALAACVAEGHRGVLVFCAQHCGVQAVRPAHEIDVGYAEALAQAVDQGVEVLAFGCTTDLTEFGIDRQLPFSL